MRIALEDHHPLVRRRRGDRAQVAVEGLRLRRQAVGPADGQHRNVHAGVLRDDERALVGEICGERLRHQRAGVVAVGEVEAHPTRDEVPLEAVGLAELGAQEVVDGGHLHLHPAGPGRVDRGAGRTVVDDGAPR
jgi:hypothetical protein